MILEGRKAELEALGDIDWRQEGVVEGKEMRRTDSSIA